MSGYLFYDCRPRPLSITGAPMPGATYTFYESQTTTPAVVYADADLTTPLTNPVVADSDGRFPAIYLDPAIVYRVQLHDADGVLQYDVDPVHPHVAIPPGTIVMFDGTPEQRDAAYPPALWQVLDGSNGTKDSRDRSPVGVSNTKPISGEGSSGGTISGTTGPAGAHDHGGATAMTVLTEDNMPRHHHRLWCWTAGTGVDSRIVDPVNHAGKPGGLCTVWQSSSSPKDYAENNVGGIQLVEDAGMAIPDGHNHAIDGVSDHTHSIQLEPPYFTVWFLMRRAS